MIQGSYHRVSELELKGIAASEFVFSLLRGLLRRRISKCKTTSDYTSLQDIWMCVSVRSIGINLLVFVKIPSQKDSNLFPFQNSLHNRILLRKPIQSYGIRRHLLVGRVLSSFS